MRIYYQSSTIFLLTAVTLGEAYDGGRLRDTLQWAIMPYRSSSGGSGAMLFKLTVTITVTEKQNIIETVTETEKNESVNTIENGVN